MGFLQIYFHTLPPEKLLQTIGITVGFAMIQHPHCAKACSSIEQKRPSHHKINLFSSKNRKKEGNYISIPI